MSAESVPPSPAAPRAADAELPQSPAVPPAPVGATAEYPAHGHADPTGRRLGILSLTALGVVYGDIGTSPLYAMRECFKPEYGLAPTPTNVYGILSLIIWSLILIVSIKYIVFIMRADNRGEGGILALLALILQRTHRDSEARRRAILVALGLFGAALLYGDGVITPAMSVLSAVEGIEVAAPALQPWVVILTLVILSGVFFFQQYGTERVGKIFGPVMLLWFGTIGVLGLVHIFDHPGVLQALNPLHGLSMFVHHGARAFLVLGAVVLAVTGAEALYADMGHFGRRPIRLAWFAVVLPALLLNYFGQGALILSDPKAIENPFYLLAPTALLYPLIALATVAAVIASQALISGAFSLTQSSVQLGYSPRVNIVHTSEMQHGQIYIPEVNKALALGCLLVVLGFRSSTALGAAYGIAVTGTMAITTMLFYVVARDRWNWPLWKAGSITALFLAVDLAFFAANVIKIEQGGWVPLAIAVGIFVLMTTWKRGRSLLHEMLRSGTLPLELFLDDAQLAKTVRVPGTAVFMTSDPDGVPVVLLHHLKHNKVLHQQVVLLSVMSAEVPELASSGKRVSVEKLTMGFFRVTARYGFMETPNVVEVMKVCGSHGLKAKPHDTTYYLGRERLLTIGPAKMMRWRKKLFAFMARNARSATEFFGIPPNRVVELGTQVEF
jgi:KUP system potassium uptake protein